MNNFIPDEDFLKTLTVLYVEDDRDTRDQLAQYLSRRVGTLMTAENGLAGVGVFRSHRSDMVVTDIQMSEMDGLAMAQEIRTLDRDVPIIVTTAFEQTDYLARSIEAGVDKYVTKPIEPERLYATMLQLAHRLQEEVVSQRMAKLLHQSQLQSMASELALTEERERVRIADGLHDHVVQNLAVATFTLDSLIQSLPQTADREVVQTVRDVIGSAIKDLRSLTFDLSPPVLFDDGLVAAIKYLAEKVEFDHGIPVQCFDDGSDKPLENDLLIMLYRSVRELVINVVKHAHATNVRLSTARVGNEIRVEVEDNGQGFNAAVATLRPSTAGGYGLSSIRQRFKALGGNTIIESQPGKGSRVTLVAPFEKKSVQ